MSTINGSHRTPGPVIGDVPKKLCNYKAKGKTETKTLVCIVESTPKACLHTLSHLL